MIIAFRSLRRLLTLSTLLSLVLAVSASAAGLSAVVTQEVRPVLVRNAHNRLFRLTVTAEKPYANIKSLTISLSGTDDRDTHMFF